MTDSTEIKRMVNEMGADLCGVAPAGRFDMAPPGFRPTDIYPDCKSVLVFARRLPTGPLHASSCIPYTYVDDVITRRVDDLTVGLSLKLEDLGITNVPVPSDDPYEHWEPERCYGRAILSLRHAGYLAGLGVLGKNGLLVNKDYGNMIQIGALLLAAELKPDRLASYEFCPEDCTLCIDSCPQGALGVQTVDQELCRPLSNCVTEKGYVLQKCNLCRRVCPSCLGVKAQ